MSNFLTSLRSGRVLVMDGAMGTEIARRLRSPAVACCDDLSRSQPELVESVHAAYLDAGAEVLLTNTFQANPIALSQRGFVGGMHDIWQAAIRRAQIEHARQHFVLADVGPFKNVTPQAARTIIDECVGVDGLLLETWSSIPALQWFTERPLPANLPLLISFTFHRTSDLMTFTGARPEQCAQAAKQCGAVAVGANCGKDIGMTDLLEIVQRYRAACELPIFARPNAGSPTQGCRHDPRTPTAMTAALPALFDAGVTMIGGCCGTTPEHIRAFRDVVDAWNARLMAPALR